MTEKGITCEIMRPIAVLSENERGYTKEINLVSWNGADPKYDIRNWHPDRKKSGKGITLTEEEDILYAQWTGAETTLTYDANGGSGAPAGQTKTYGVDLKLSTTNPTREGYNFKGWATSKSSSTVSYSAGQTYSSTAENQALTLYAVWELKTYTITYYANAGNDTVTVPSVQKKNYFSTIKLSTSTPSRTGYNFKGWAISPTETKAVYQPGAEYNENTALNLYALWSEKTYTISYDVNGGKENTKPASQVKKHFSDLKLTTTVPERDGYNFKGWSESKTSTAAAYSSGGNFSKNQLMTLYAVWEIKKFKITYSSAAGTTNLPNPNPQIITWGEEYALGAAPVRSGYDFLGWSEQNNASTVQYGAGTKRTKYSDYTLYAVWKIKSYNVHYEANAEGETVTVPSDQTKVHGQTLILSTTKPERTGYNFKGWGTSNSAQSAAYQPGGEYKDNKMLTLYALWEKKTYKVTYNANDDGAGVQVPADQIFKHGEYITINTSTPKREGYTFLGWSDRKTDTAAVYHGGDKYQKNQNLSLYAIWKINTYTISYQMNSTDAVQPASISSQIKEYGKNIYLSSIIPTRQGYGFLGWSTDKNAKVKEYGAGGVFSLNKNTVLYAVWDTNSFSINYNANGTNVSNMPENQIKKYGVPIPISSKKPTREGYEFLGWGINKTDEKVSYHSGDSYSKNESVSLFAIWNKIICSIRYYSDGAMIYEQAIPYGDTGYLNAPIPKKEGYDFLGWADSPSASVANYEPGQQFKTTTDHNLYAVWKLKEYTISFYLNYPLSGTETVPSEMKKINGKSVAFPKPVPTREGYYFLGWSTNSQATSAEYRYSEEKKDYLDTYDKNADGKLYAIWEIKEYTITYDGNAEDTDDIPAPQKKIHGKEITLSMDGRKSKMHQLQIISRELPIVKREMQHYMLSGKSGLIRFGIMPMEEIWHRLTR